MQIQGPLREECFNVQITFYTKLFVNTATKDGTKFELYSKFEIFEPFSAIWFDLKIQSCLNKYCLNIFFHVLRHKIGPGWSFTFWHKYENDNI